MKTQKERQQERREYFAKKKFWEKRNKRKDSGHSSVQIMCAIISWIVLVILVALAFLGLIYLADKRMQTVEKAQCIDWQPDYEKGQGRTPPNWMVDQCERYNIKINH